jgi:hypothetical protein
LEPLAVEADGVAVAPVLVQRPRGAGRWRDVGEFAAAVARAWIDDIAGAPVGPTVRVSLPPATPVSTARHPPGFVRMLELDAAALGGFPRWWASPARSHAARAMGWSLDDLQPGAGGAWRVRGRMRRRRFGRRVPFDLLLWPHLGAFTKLVVEPRRHIRVNRSYFRRGHRALDRLIEELEVLTQPSLLGRCSS